MLIVWQIKISIYLFIFLFHRLKILELVSEFFLFIFVLIVKILHIILQSKYLFFKSIYFFSNSQFFYLIPEILLVIYLLMIIIYTYYFPKKFNKCSWGFLLVTILILSLVIFLINHIYFFNKFPMTFFDNFILINYQCYCVQISILYISIFCLVLYRRVLTCNKTNCSRYYAIYIFTTLVCLFVIMINISYLYILLISMEGLSICFYLLASFNHTIRGYLMFRFLPKKKVLIFSSILGLVGIFLLEMQSYLDYIYILESSIYCQYFLILLKKGQYLYKGGFLLIFINLLLKFIVFYGPTHRIYYEKTPTITIIYMHLIPKIITLHLVFKLIFSDFFILNMSNCNLILICTGLFCLVISIGMRRVFLKNYMEYLSLVNSGYCLLCLAPLTYNSIYLSIYFIFFYVLLMLGYGGILLYYDIDFPGGHKISFDKIYREQKYEDLCTIVIPLILFFFSGLPPTRKDYPCSRGIPFNGFIFQWIVLVSLLDGEMYLLLFFLTIFNFIVFLFFIGTVIPFWYNKLNEIKEFKILKPPRGFEWLDRYIIEFDFLYLAILIILWNTVSNHCIILSMQNYIF